MHCPSEPSSITIVLVQLALRYIQVKCMYLHSNDPIILASPTHGQHSQRRSHGLCDSNPRTNFLETTGQGVHCITCTITQIIPNNFHNAAESKVQTNLRSCSRKLYSIFGLTADKQTGTPRVKKTQPCLRHCMQSMCKNNDSEAK